MLSAEIGFVCVPSENEAGESFAAGQSKEVPDAPSQDERAEDRSTAGDDPPTWRSFELRGDTLLKELHDVLHVSFDWTNSHLHSFQTRGIEYSGPEFLLEEAEDEMDAKIEEAAPVKRSKFSYLYDFGDAWERYEEWPPAGFDPDAVIRPASTNG